MIVTINLFGRQLSTNIHKHDLNILEHVSISSKGLIFRLKCEKKPFHLLYP